MNIVMLTNSFTPIVGGTIRSVQLLAGQLRQQGHRVTIVAPSDPDADPTEADVVRFPAIPRVMRERYALPIVLPGVVSTVLADLRPDIVHAHHPFLLGEAAKEYAELAHVPLVYTHHTNYQQHIELSTSMPRVLERMILRQITDYCNRCQHVITPSDGIAALLRDSGVETPTTTIPTGIDVARFSQGSGTALRERLGIAGDARVIGHVGRLSPEKNLVFLAETVAEALRQAPQAHFLLVGEGPEQAQFDQWLGSDPHLAQRYHALGVLQGQQLADAYHAIDLFAFSSKSETQGLVLAEAMAAGAPVVALSAIGVDDIVDDGVNGRVLAEQDTGAFAAALVALVEADGQTLEQMSSAARQTADGYSVERFGERVARLYEHVSRTYHPDDQTVVLPKLLQSVGYHLQAWGRTFAQAGSALSDPQS